MFISSDLGAKLRIHFGLLLLVTAIPVSAQTASKLAGSAAVTAAPAISPAVKKTLSLIQAANLRGDLSFLASDALEGRYTPSSGLNVAAEFIASQFRAAGLQPGGDHDYFQIVSMVDRKMPKPSSPMTLQEGADRFTVSASSILVTATSASITLDRCPVVVMKERKPEALHGIELKDKVVVAPAISFQNVAPDQRDALVASMRAFDKAVKSSDAKALVLVGQLQRVFGALLSAEQIQQQTKVPVIDVESDDLRKWIDSPGSKEGRTITFEIPAPQDHKVELKNVVAVLPGSDPQLKSTYVMLTAHYDHIGTFETGKSLSETKESDPVDRIFNGANDDGSGTVSVIEIAKALAHLNPRPKRSLIFMTFFGEERGDIGSGYYGSHPLFPIAKTVADLNLEQVGRTDSTEGKQMNNASVTGYDYSEVTKYLEKAGRLTGIKVYMEKPASDDYFVRSDNAALAEQGVPAHTLCVAFDYSDYHGLGDEWQKVDYENMARVDRMVALGLIDIANNPVAPRWNRSNPKTAQFREAQLRLAGRKQN